MPPQPAGNGCEEAHVTEKMVEVEFSGGVMEATLGPNNEPFVNVKRVCEELGVSYTTQYRKLKSKPWATVLIMSTVGSDGKERDMLCINARAVPMWAATITSSKVKAELQERLVDYQMKSAEVLADYFMGSPPAVIATRGDTLARLATVQEMADAALKIGAQLTTVAVDHEHRLRTLEAKPVVMLKTTHVGERRRLLTRWIARFREETGPMTEGMSQEEKSRYFSDIHSSLNRVFGDKKNWRPEKFYEAARWLKRRYHIDITDIEEA